MVEDECVPREAATRAKRPSDAFEDTAPIRPRGEVEEGAVRADDEVGGRFEIEVAHVALAQLERNASRGRMLASEREHRGGEVDPDDVLSGALHDRNRDAPGAGGELDDRAVRLAGELDVELDVVGHVGRPRVVDGREALVAAHHSDSSSRNHVGNLGAPVDAQALENAALAAAEAAATADEVEQVRVEFLGRKSELKLALREVRDRETGMALNALREKLESAIDERQQSLERAELDRRLTDERVDVTMPGTPVRRGQLHLITQIRREVEDIFLGLGYTVVDGREVETTTYNFDALNFPLGHPTRSPLQTLFLDDETVLRTETSPSQIRTMEAQDPPVYIVSLGRVYRRDTPDATHTPTFHQVEGLVVDEGITLGDLMGTLDYLLKALFGESRREPIRHASLPVHRAVRRGARLLPHLRRVGLPGLQALRLDRGRRLGNGRPEPLRVRGLRPRPVHGLRVRLGARADRRAPAWDPRSPRALAERPAVAGTVPMKAPLSWLREYVTVKATTSEIAERLFTSALQVDEVSEVGVPDVDGNIGRFLVGRVLEVLPHPNADRLRVCQVDVGEGDARQIVCGAWNFEAGATVAVALPGAYLPIFDQPLDERELRGEPSRGMILAEDEVGLGEDHAGIMVLLEGPEPGTPLVDVLPIRDWVLDVTPTVNRADLLSMVGLAREVAALLGGELHPPTPADPLIVDEEEVDVTVDDFGACPRYIGRVFRDVAIGASPQWLRTRLHLADMRSISNVVDVTNYVMHVWGSPLHAFDRAKLAGGRIAVRHARAGEEVRTLDGTLRRLETDDLLITDGERAVALAAIMGGEDSEVTDETSEVLLEAANFEPLGILRSSERLALRTAGSNRWEKGVDPHLAEPAAVLASRMLVDLTGARLTGHVDVHAGLPERPVVHLRPGARVEGDRAGHPAGRAAGDPRRIRLRRRRRLERGRPDLARPRRHARDRPRRGDRATGPRSHSAHDAPAASRSRSADEGAAATSGRGGRARRSGPVRGVHVEPCRLGSESATRSGFRAR